MGNSGKEHLCVKDGELTKAENKYIRCDFIAVEYEDDRECSYCRQNITCLQLAQKLVGGNIKLCPDCYDDS